MISLREEAISHYRIAIEIMPGFAAAYSYLEGALLHAEMTKQAIDSFKEAIRIQPGYAAAQKNLKIAISKLEKQ
jgi:protein O-GlcNAc transferase